MEDAGETGVTSGEKTDILDSLSTEGALELSRVIELSRSFEAFFDAGGGISVICFSGEPERSGDMRSLSAMIAMITHQWSLLSLLSLV